jgi:ferrochelatase
MKTGVLLLNLGTPNSPSPRSVATYLSEFLMDGRVIDLPFLLRACLVFGLIVPIRSFVAAKAYKKIWTSAGSPLLINSINIKNKLQTKLGNNYVVNLAMRYANPNIKGQLYNLLQQNCNNLIIIPLFPQYSSAATGSAVAKVLQKLQASIVLPNIQIVTDFYMNKFFIQAWAERIKTSLHNKKYEILLFSYHGLPERHILEPAVQSNQQYCYRRQCYATTELIAQELKLSKNQYAISFQSRLGRTPWIKPYTDKLMPDLIKQGIKNIAICCPSFVADCIETLEEIGISAKQAWQNSGGTELHAVPCINDADLFIECLISLIQV